jgi:protein TonB
MKAIALLALTLAVLGPGAAATFAAADSAPRILEMVEPVYPPRAIAEGIGGTVLVRIKVNADGSVSGVRVVEGVEGCPELGESAAEALRRSTFAPATKDGRPVVGRAIVPVKFALDDCEDES